MRKIISITSLLFFLSVYTAYAIEYYDFKVKEAIELADIHRSQYTKEPTIHLYQGNGHFGCSFALQGLHVHPSDLDKDSKYGKTQFMHIEHFGRAKYKADYLLPLVRVYWDTPFDNVANYSQHQSFYDGTITTTFTSGQTQANLMTWFDAVEKDVACIAIDIKGATRNIVVDPGEIFKLHYDQEVPQSVNIEQKGNYWKFTLTCLGKKAYFYLLSNVKGEVRNNKLCLTLKNGKNNIQISYKTPTNTSPDKSLKQTIEWWHQKWDNSGCIRFPDTNAHKMWVRSMAQFLSSYNEEKLGLSPPMGFTGNGWPFPFPQDVSYVHPILLSTGNINMAKSWIEYFAERIAGMKAYTKRLTQAEGILSPWVYPYGDFNEFHDPVPPNICYYEIHNSGYLARMAHETAILVNDERWTRKYAVPLIKETAAFYSSICKKESDGLWHIFMKPGMGQDEMGGVNQKDYLCALYSAKYCFQQAITYSLDTDKKYQKILNDGLAFKPLKSAKGFYFSCNGRGEEDFGKQKHPVQLNELAYLPTEKSVSHEGSTAYILRYDITQKANQPYFHGWTLGEFLLAGSRFGNEKEWLRDWDNMLKSDYIDSDYIQVFETSKSYGASFYNTTNGLIAQSLINNLICDWYGELEIARCNPWKEAICFKNIYSLLGVKISGVIKGKEATLSLSAWKDTSIRIRGKQIVLKKGEIYKYSTPSL